MHVFGEAFVFLGLLQELDGVAAGVAHDHLGLLAGGLGLLDEVLAALFGQGGDGAADDFAVVLRGEAEIGVHNRFLNLGNHILFPGLEGESLGIGSRDGGYLVHGSGRAVVIDHKSVENGRVGLAYAVGLEVFFKEVEGVLHLVGGAADDFFCSVCQHIVMNYYACTMVPMGSPPRRRARLPLLVTSNTTMGTGPCSQSE